MDYGFQGRVALVTGTASQVGMGNAICLTLAKEGCDVVSADMDFDGANQTALAVRTLGREALALKVDVAKSFEVDEMTKIILKKFGRIDILVNTAGGNFGLGVPFLESKQEIWEKDFAVNLYGTMNCAKAVLPNMVEHKYGKIINFSSVGAKSGGPSSYGASKAAVLAFTRGLATQFGPSGINVNAIAPGILKTKFFTGYSGDRVNKMSEDMAARVPLRRIQTVDDVANAVAFLASELSKNITGQCIQVDSGLIML